MREETHTFHKTCNLCEAMCGLLIEVRDNQVESIKPDPNDPLSHGAICPKAIALREIQHDPDRLRLPVKRSHDGWVTISWEEAFSLAAERLSAIQLESGNDAVASYLGNPGAHNFGITLYLTLLNNALDTRNRYTASSLDQNPKHASSLLLYGNYLSIPIPDIDRTDFMLVLGANPVVSNGSLMSVPGFGKRIRLMQERGGELVVVDPKRTETAEIADLHVPIQPGRDPLLLAALIHCVMEEDLGRASHLASFIDGLDQLEQQIAPFSPESVEAELGITQQTIRGIARRYAGASSAVCYGRVGTCMSPYGTLNSWLIDVLNLLTGNLDRVGGVMFPEPAADLAALLELRGLTGELDSGRTRVRGAACFNGERPTACLAEEILTPGEGQIRGMVTIAGNPCLSAPNGPALQSAFVALDFYVAIDFYINETTQHADIILPPTWSLEHDNHEILFHGFAVRNTAKYSPCVIAPDPDQRHDWQILSELACRIGVAKQPNPLKRAALRLAKHLVPSPRKAIDGLLRLGAYGDGFRPWRKGLRLRDLEASPSGVDLGPLKPRLATMLEEHERRINLAPEVIMAELDRLDRDRATPSLVGDQLLLIGRRDVRTNNSWLHNTRVGTRGKERCTLQMHPDDAIKRNLDAAESVRISSRVGQLIVPLELCDKMMPGVVSLPHGWGHRGKGLELRVATQHPGVNCNDLTDDAVLEPVVGNAIFNGVPVEVTRV